MVVKLSVDLMTATDYKGTDWNDRYQKQRIREEIIGILSDKYNFVVVNPTFRCWPYHLEYEFEQVTLASQSFSFPHVQKDE